MNKYKYILFDLDGTLTDPKRGIINSFKTAFEKLDIFIEENEIVNLIGPPLVESLENYFQFDKETIESVLDSFRRYYNSKGFAENRVYAGIRELLAKLVLNGYILAVATSKPEHSANQVLEHFELSEYFDFIGGSSLDNTRIQKVDVIKYVLENLKISKNDYDKVIMVGDRKHDIIGAKENGLDSMAITHGYGSKEELYIAKPTYTAKSAEDIYTILMTSPKQEGCGKCCGSCVCGG